MPLVAALLATLTALVIAILIAAVTPHGVILWIVAPFAAVLIAGVSLAVLVACAEWEARR